MLALASGGAEARKAKKEPPTPKPTLLKLNAVAGQEIFLRHGMSLERDCTPLRPIRVVVTKPPKGGTVTSREIQSFPNYERENVRFKCNSERHAAMAAYYTANDTFKGTDHFSFAVIYYDGEARFYDVEMVVWR